MYDYMGKFRPQKAGQNFILASRDHVITTLVAVALVAVAIVAISPLFNVALF